VTRSRSRLAGLVAATLIAAAGLVGFSVPPASAALCSGKGVNVVVEFRALGGGVRKGCDPSGGNRAARAVFGAAGFTLKDHPGEQGFVCQIDSKPRSVGDCKATDSYWGLYWSDGKSGRWTYATSGVDGLKVPTGGFVAFAWQGTSEKTPPVASPVNKQAAPKPTPKPSPKAATKSPQKVRTQQSESGSAPAATTAPKPKNPTKTSAATDDKPKAKKSKAAARASTQAKASASASASSSASESAAASTESDDATPEATSAEKANSTFTSGEEQNGLPFWVPILVVLALAGSAGGTAWWRRRTGAP